MTRFFLTEAARADLKEIGHYTKSRWGRVQRDKYLVALDDSFKALAQSPQSGVECDDIRAGYRKRRSGSHVIFYRVLERETVEIVRILHGNMEPEHYLPE